MSGVNHVECHDNTVIGSKQLTLSYVQMSRLSLETQGVSLMQLSVDRCCGVAGSWRVLTQWRTQKISTGGASVCIIPSGPFPLMVMHTLCAGFVRSPQRLDLAQLTKILAHPLGFARTLITPRNRIAKKITYFSDRGCVRPLRHLYGYATVLRYSEKRLMRPCRIAFAASVPCTITSSSRVLG